jgi:hypothetical protein
MIAFMTFALRRASKIRKHTLVDVLPEIPKTYGILKLDVAWMRYEWMKFDFIQLHPLISNNRNIG